jgi:hypothetical protein
MSEPSAGSTLPAVVSRCGLLASRLLVVPPINDDSRPFSNIKELVGCPGSLV